MNRHRDRVAVWVLLVVAFAAMAAKPTTRKADDDILGFAQPGTAPAATAPATTASPLSSDSDTNPGRDGDIKLNDGTTASGKIATTADKPLRVWVEAQKEYQDIPIDMVSTVEAKVLWERDEKEWNFKESGSDIKVYSGRTYPARETQYKFTLTDGTVIEGGIVAPIYLTTADGKSQTFILHKRDKGDFGKSLKSLVYVDKITFK